MNGVGLGVDWDWQLLEALIQDRGDYVIWETAVACPACRREDAVASFNEKNPNEAIRIRRPNCPNCHGWGFIYRNATKVLGLLTAVNAGNRQLIDIGLALPGDAVFSPSLYEAVLTDMDRVTLCLTDVLHEGQTIQRGAAHMSNASLIPDDLLSTEDRLWYAGNGCAVWCEDENNVVYDVEGDFQIIDNKIRWIGKTPKDGVFYTLKYHYYPEFVVYASPLERVDRGRNLQQRVVLRKKHLAYTQATAVATPAQRQEEQIALTGRTKI
jgi:hypothetical protein